MNHNVSLSGVILPPPLLNFDGKPRRFGKNRAFDFEKNSPRKQTDANSKSANLVHSFVGKKKPFDKVADTFPFTLVKPCPRNSS